MKSATVLASGLIVASMGMATGQNSSFTLRILHVNDHHSHLAEEEFTVTTVPDLMTADGNATEEVDVVYGGFPRLIALFDELKSVAAAEDIPVLTLHAGDMVTGTLFYTLFTGEADAKLMHPICFDVVTLGNHEFDDGEENLANVVDMVLNGNPETCNTTAVVSANFAPAADSPMRALLDSGVIMPYHVQTYGDAQVGIIGVTTVTTSLTSFPEPDSNFTDIMAAVSNAVDELEGMNITKIIVLSHVGYDQDVSKLATIGGVDVVVGGHTHSLLGQSVLQDILTTVEGEFPTVETIARQAGDMVCVVTAWEYGHGLGNLLVEFDANGVVTNCTGSPIFPFDDTSYDPPLDDASAAAMTTYLTDTGAFRVVQPDATALEIIQEYQDEVEQLGGEVIASVPAGICYERIPGTGGSQICPTGNATYGGGACNVVAQGFLDQIREADVAIQNAGGCRADINKGDYTINDAFTMLPFSNTMVTLEMTGAQIQQVLNDAVFSALYATETSSGAYPYAAGLRYIVDARENSGDFVRNIEVNIRLTSDAWTRMDMQQTYVVATNDFIAAGQDGYFTFADIDDGLYTDTFLEYAQTFVDYARKVGTLVDPPLETYSTQGYAGPGESDPPENLSDGEGGGGGDDPAGNNTGGSSSDAFGALSSGVVAVAAPFAAALWF